MTFNEILELTVLAFIVIELIVLYRYTRFHRQIDEHVSEAVNRHLEKSDALIKILDGHIEKLDLHVEKLDEHIHHYTKYIDSLKTHMGILEEMVQKITRK